MIRPGIEGQVDMGIYQTGQNGPRGRFDEASARFDPPRQFRGRPDGLDSTVVTNQNSPIRQGRGAGSVQQPACPDQAR
jgi:hypothetical protein